MLKRVLLNTSYKLCHVLLGKRELPTYENRNILTANENREFGSKKTSPNLDFTFFIFLVFQSIFSFKIFTFLLSSLRARHASVMVILERWPYPCTDVGVEK